MANNGDIYITITSEPIGTQANEGSAISGDGGQAKKVKKDASAGDFAKHQFFNFAENQAKQFISYTVGNIGNFTGNYQTQRQVQEMLRVGGMLKNIGVTTARGAMIGGPIGAVIGAVVATASQAISLAYEDHALTVQTKQQNREINMMRKISGLDGLTNGSRWGG